MFFCVFWILIASSNFKKNTSESINQVQTFPPPFNNSENKVAASEFYLYKIFDWKKEEEIFNFSPAKILKNQPIQLGKFPPEFR